MSGNIVTVEALIKRLEIFNNYYPRPGMGALTLSDAVNVSDSTASWPNCTLPGVYALIKNDEEVVYIGKASCNTNLGFRLGSYFYADGRPKHQWLEGVTHVRTIAVNAEHSFEAPAIEEYLIQKLNPPLNVTGRKRQEQNHE